MTEAAAPASWRPGLTFAQLWACLAVALPVLGALLAPISTVDLAYHLRAGAMILDTGRLPSPDVFTFTAAGERWLDQQWGAQVVLATVFRVGGWALLAVGRAALVGLIAGLVLWGCRSAGAGLRVAAWLTLAGFGVGLVSLALRPQLLGMALFALTLAILAARRRHPRLAWAIPLVVLAWSSVHGSFFLAPAAVGVAWLEDLTARRPGSARLLVIAILSAAATLLNPYGLEIWTYAVGLSANPTIRRLITEWQATSPLSFAGLVFYGSIVGVAALAVLAARRGALRPRFAWPTLLWLVGLAAIGTYAERGVAWWSIAAPITAAGLVALLPAGRVAVAAAATPPDDGAPGAGPVAAGPARERRSLLNTAIVAVLALAILALLPVWRGGDPRYGPSGLLADAPKGITDALLATVRPGDRIWSAQRWGSWLELTVPEATVAVDSRIELVPADAWTDHLALSGGSPDWASILERRGVTLVVASATEQAALIRVMRAGSLWRLRYEDGEGAIFERAARDRSASLRATDASRPCRPTLKLTSRCPRWSA